MAKRSFILFIDTLSVLDEMTDDQAGKLFKAIKAYQQGESLELDFAIKMAFLPFKNQFVRDEEKWNETKVSRSESGRLGGIRSAEARKQNQANEANASTVKQNQANQAVTVSVNDTVNASVTGSVTVTSNTKGACDEKKPGLTVAHKQVESAEPMVYPTFNDFWNLYDKKIGREKSEKKWGKLTQSEREKILEYLPGYIAATPDAQYRKNPETFLNNKSWNDEIISREKQPAGNRTLSTEYLKDLERRISS